MLICRNNNLLKVFYKLWLKCNVLFFVDYRMEESKIDKCGFLKSDKNVVSKKVFKKWRYWIIFMNY